MSCLPWVLSNLAGSFPLSLPAFNLNSFLLDSGCHCVCMCVYTEFLINRWAVV